MDGRITMPSEKEIEEAMEAVREFNRENFEATLKTRIKIALEAAEKVRNKHRKEEDVNIYTF
jgi:hypothetical protein